MVPDPLAGFISLPPLPSPFLSLNGYGDLEIFPPWNWAITLDSGKTQKCPFASSCLFILATNYQENRGKCYQRHFCSKETLLSDHYYLGSFFCFFDSVIIFLALIFVPVSLRHLNLR